MAPIETRAKWTDLIPDTGLKVSVVFDQGDDLYTPGVSNVLNVETVDGAFRKILGSVKSIVIRGTLRFSELRQPLASKSIKFV